MKTIQLKKWDDIIPANVIDQKPQSITTLELIRTALCNKPDEQGFSIEQMRLHIKVLDKLEKTDGNVLILEDAEHKVLKDAVNRLKWQFPHLAFIEFTDDINNAK